VTHTDTRPAVVIAPVIWARTHAVAMTELGFESSASMSTRRRSLACRRRGAVLRAGLDELLRKKPATGRCFFHVALPSGRIADVHFVCVGTRRKRVSTPRI